MEGQGEGKREVKREGTRERIKNGHSPICTLLVLICPVETLDVLYAIHQLTITFVTYIFKITSLTLRSYFSGARAKKVFCKKTGHIT